MNKLVPFPFGIFFTTGDKLSSTSPNKFKPITKIKEAKNKTK